MNDSAKIKLNLRNGEVEIEGSEKFVEKQIDNLEALMKLMGKKHSEAADVPSSESEEPVGEGQGSAENDGMPSTFGEWIQMFKSDVSDLDKALITARYVQHESQTNDFKTSDVNKSLKEHGIKLSNPSTSLKRLITKKHLFQTRRVGKLIYMRVSVDGQKYLESLKMNG